MLTLLPRPDRALVLLLGILALVLSSGAFAQSRPDRFERGLLWRIEKPGAEPSHVFGTIHVSDVRVTQIPANVARSIERLQLADGRSLREIVGRREFGRASLILAEDGIEPRTLDRLTPFGAISFLTVRPKASVGTLDVRLADFAQRAGVPTAGLESIDEQFRAVERVAESAFVAELRAMLADPATFQQYMETLVSRYREEAIGSLLAMVRENPPWTRGIAGPEPRVGAEVVDRRNARMVDRMLPMLARGRAFVAVGAAHLGGESGVLAQLERQGYLVTRVRLD